MTDIERNRRCLSIHLLALCCIVLAACSSAPEITAALPEEQSRAAAPNGEAARPIERSEERAVPERGEEIIFSAWRPLTLKPTDAWKGPRTRLYTYVLVGDLGMRQGQLSMNAHPAKVKAYLALIALLKEVEAHEALPIAGDPAWTPEMLMQANQFCIPAQADTLTQVNTEHYDTKLAASYVRQFTLILEARPDMKEHLAGPGPFFVATRKPLGEIIKDAKGKRRIDDAEPILLVDMTGSPSGAIPTYVDAFRKAVRQGISDQGVLHSLRADFVRLVIAANEAVPKVAEAGKKILSIL